MEIDDNIKHLLWCAFLSGVDHANNEWAHSEYNIEYNQEPHEAFEYFIKELKLKDNL